MIIEIPSLQSLSDLEAFLAKLPEEGVHVFVRKDGTSIAIEKNANYQKLYEESKKSIFAKNIILNELLDYLQPIRMEYLKAGISFQKRMQEILNPYEEDLEAADPYERIKQIFTDIITLDPWMLDPVIDLCGHTFSEKSIKGVNNCPLNRGQSFTNATTKTNISIQQLMAIIFTESENLRTELQQKMEKEKDCSEKLRANPAYKGKNDCEQLLELALAINNINLITIILHRFKEGFLARMDLEGDGLPLPFFYHILRSFVKQISNNKDQKSLAARVPDLLLLLQKILAIKDCHGKTFLNFLKEIDHLDYCLTRFHCMDLSLLFSLIEDFDFSRLEGKSGSTLIKSIFHNFPRILHYTVEQSSNNNEFDRFIKQLVSAGVNINAYSDGETPILIAARKNTDSVLLSLLELGANPTLTGQNVNLSTFSKMVVDIISEEIRWKFDERIWSFAIRIIKANTDNYREIFQKYGYLVTSKTGGFVWKEIPLWPLIFKDSIDEVIRLSMDLLNQNNPHWFNEKLGKLGDTAAIVAVRFKKFEVFEWLQAIGVDLSIKNSAGEDVIDVALQVNCFDDLRPYLLHDKYLHYKDIHGNNLLMNAVIHKQEQRINALIKLPFDYSNFNVEGKTIFHLVIINRNFPLLEKLNRPFRPFHWSTPDIEGNFPAYYLVAKSDLRKEEDARTFINMVNHLKQHHLLGGGLLSLRGENIGHVLASKGSLSEADCIISDSIAMECEMGSEFTRGYLPLHQTIASGNFAMFIFFLLSNFRQNVHARGVTPLHLAISNNAIRYVEALLRLGNCDISICDPYGNNALLLSLLSNNLDMISLVAKYAKENDPHQFEELLKLPNINNQTALDLIKQIFLAYILNNTSNDNKMREFIALFPYDLIFHSEDPQRQTLFKIMADELEYYTTQGEFSYIKRVLDLGFFKIEDPLPSGETILQRMLATHNFIGLKNLIANHGHEDLIRKDVKKALVENIERLAKGQIADLLDLKIVTVNDSITPSNQTSLHLLANSNQFEELAKYCEIYGGNLDIPDNNGITARAILKEKLFAAAESGDTDLIENFFLKYKWFTDIDDSNDDKQTLLQVALRHHQFLTANFLLANHADRELTHNPDVNTPVKIIEEHLQDWLKGNLKFGNLQNMPDIFKIIRFLLEQQIDINNKSHLDVALHRAAFDNHFEFCEFLLKNDADVNARNANNLTPLEMTTDPKIFKLLLTHGADPSLIVNNTIHNQLKILLRDFVDDVLNQFIDFVLNNKKEEAKDILKKYPYLHKKIWIILTDIAAGSKFGNNINKDFLNNLLQGDLFITWELERLAFLNYLCFIALKKNQIAIFLTLYNHGASLDYHPSEFDTFLSIPYHPQTLRNDLTEELCQYVILNILSNEHIELIKLVGGPDSIILQPEGYSNRVSLLQIALDKERYNAAKFLLQNGANLEFSPHPDKEPSPLLRIITKLKKLIPNKDPVSDEEILTLLKFLSDLNMPLDDDNNRVLHLIAKHNNVGLLTSLPKIFDDKLDFDATNKFGQTPAHLLASCENKSAFFLFLSKQKNINISDAKGKTPIRVFFEKVGWLTAFSWMQQKDTLSAQSLSKALEDINSWQFINADGSSSFILHAIIHEIATPKSLQNSRNDQYFLSNFIITFLHDHPKILDQRDSMGRLPLHLAAEYRLWDFIEFLKKHGARLDATDSNGSTPLHSYLLGLINSMDSEAVPFDQNCKDLLLSKENFNFSNVHGETPLTLCAKLFKSLAKDENFKEFVNELLKKGVNPFHIPGLEKIADEFANEKNKELDCCIARQYIERSMIAIGSYPYLFDLERFNQKFLQGDIFIKDIIQNIIFSLDGHLINAQFRYGNTLAHWAAKNGHSEILKLLAKKNADFMLLNSCNEIPLHLAARFRHVNCLEILLALPHAVIQTTVRNSSNLTALEESVEKSSMNCIKLLCLFSLHIENIKSDQQDVIIFMQEIQQLEIDIKTLF
jgi:ankyrin repeat protein